MPPSIDLQEAVKSVRSIIHPLEPFFLPKLQSNFADFPNLHYSKSRGLEPWRPDAVISTTNGMTGSREIFKGRSPSSGGNNSIVTLYEHLRPNR